MWTAGVVAFSIFSVLGANLYVEKNATVSSLELKVDSINSKMAKMDRTIMELIITLKFIQPELSKALSK